MIESVAGVRQVSITENNDFTELKLILDGEDALPGVMAQLTKRGSSLLGLEKREPTLEDVFIDLVGHGLDVNTADSTEEN
jgi:ABC-2 type transport system ATP-binding protein